MWDLFGSGKAPTIVFANNFLKQLATFDCSVGFASYSLVYMLLREFLHQP